MTPKPQAFNPTLCTLLTFAVDLHLRGTETGIRAHCAGGAADAAARCGDHWWAIGGAAGGGADDLGPERRGRGHRRGHRNRGRGSGLSGGLQFDATRQGAAPLTTGQAGEHPRSLHAVSRGTTDLRLGAIVRAIGSMDNGAVVVARQGVALHN